MRLNFGVTSALLDRFEAPLFGKDHPHWWGLVHCGWNNCFHLEMLDQGDPDTRGIQPVFVNSARMQALLRRTNPKRLRTGQFWKPDNLPTYHLLLESAGRATSARFPAEIHYVF
jgi:hypothetical protein